MRNWNTSYIYIRHYIAKTWQLRETHRITFFSHSRYVLNALHKKRIQKAGTHMIVLEKHSAALQWIENSNFNHLILLHSSLCVSLRPNIFARKTIFDFFTFLSFTFQIKSIFSFAIRIFMLPELTSL